MFLSSAACNSVGEARTASHMTAFTSRKQQSVASAPPSFKLRRNLPASVRESRSAEKGSGETEQQQQRCYRRPPGTEQSSWFPAAGVGHTLIKSRHLIDTLSKVPCRWTKGNRLVLQPRPAHRSPSANCVCACVCVLCRCACTFERTPLSFLICGRVCVFCVFTDRFLFFVINLTFHFFFRTSGHLSSFSLSFSCQKALLLSFTFFCPRRNRTHTHTHAHTALEGVIYIFHLCECVFFFLPFVWTDCVN